MTSTLDHGPHTPVKGKLNHIKVLLDEANKRLQREAARYEIFTTKTSALGAPATAPMVKHNGARTQSQNALQEAPKDLQRTLSDIGTIQSVLSCPLFDIITNLTDSLDKLSYHVNMRPSIGPVDFDFDSNGELILAPPIEPASLNNLINSRLDEFSNRSQNSSPHIMSSKDIIQSSGDSNNGLVNGANSSSIMTSDFGNTDRSRVDAHRFDVTSHQEALIMTPKHVIKTHADIYAQAHGHKSKDESVTSVPISNEIPDDDDESSRGNVFAPTLMDHPTERASRLQKQRSEAHQNRDTEKLVTTNGSGKDYVNGRQRRRSQETSKVQSVAAVFESAIAESSETKRLYKANGNFALDQLVPNKANAKRDYEIARSAGQINEAFHATDDNVEATQMIGYSNDMYKTAHELAGVEKSVLSESQKASLNGTELGAYANNIPMATNNEGKAQHASAKNNETAASDQRASPSTSASSTIRLADECDSGTSSFRSQAAKGTLYSPQSHRPIAQLEEDTMDRGMDQELIAKLSPEMERIKVTLEKDTNGLGITIAGYTCEQEEISGIFIKSIVPGSPADRSGKIRILDQIFAVNGQEILGYSNPEATNVLRRQSGRVVTLELMRYLAESKYKKLQTLLGHAEPTPTVQASNSKNGHDILTRDSKTAGNYRLLTKNPAEGVRSDLIPARPGMSPASPNQLLEGRASVQTKQCESVHNNTIEALSSCGYASRPHAGSPTPVAAQRGATSSNKVIETKQGARNTIDIRSPMCQTNLPPSNATYMNESLDMMYSNSVGSMSNTSRSITDRLKQEAAEEFGQLVRTEKLEWERDVQIIELHRDSSQSLGFTVRDYANPKDPQQSIFMIVLLTPGGIAEQDGRLSVGDLLVFVDDTNLEGASPNEAVRALRRTSGHVRLGVLKYKRNF